MYQMHEGSFALPSEWQDKTMNVFLSAATGTEGVSFGVTREPLPWGMKFHEFTIGEIDKLARKVPDYVALSTNEATLSGRVAATHEFKWSNNGASIHQQITMVEYGQIVLMLTFTSPGAISESQRGQLRSVLDSMQLRDPH